MSAPIPHEIELLAPAARALRLAVARVRGDHAEARTQILEACAARFGGFDLATYHKTFGIKPTDRAHILSALAVNVVVAIEQTPIEPALALSALARETLDEAERKSTGAYHTDFRLATRVAELAAPGLTHRSMVIDPACGAGILLAALTIAICGRDRAKVGELYAHGLCAADLSANSLRAALLALASMTDDLPALVKMRARWLCGDSLMTPEADWRAMAPHGFDAVVGNPPWEKVKLSRHEFLKASGETRHYGAASVGLDEARFAAEREGVASYARKLLAWYPDLANGEPDLYVAFTALFMRLCKEGGVVSALVPGGLIRSKGTEALRAKLFATTDRVSISVIDNRAKFFAIDTRFKFLAVAFVKSGTRRATRDAIRLTHQRGTHDGLEITGSAIIGRERLGRVRPDLSIPEVRSQAEWSVFLRASRNGVEWTSSASEWHPSFCREVDMTKERPKFLAKPTKTALPLVEGRMVHHHRFGVKGHAEGTGRKAIWDAFPMGESKLKPQFWIELGDVPTASRTRASMARVGFCDIAGQTNERSLMASMIPPGVVCGNKVPTIAFSGAKSDERSLVWLAVANSFAFDWMLRRVLTTTVNYFLLQSLPLPRVARDGLPWRKLVSSASELRRLDTAGSSEKVLERIATLRAEIDAEVAVAYGLTVHDLALMLRDFPILDRGQPPLPNEHRSTMTRDTMLAAACKRLGAADGAGWGQRARAARDLGARAYIPSEISDANSAPGSGEEDRDHG